MNVKSLVVLAAAVLIGVVACGSGALSSQVGTESSELKPRAPDVVLQWNEIALNTMVDAGTGPVPQVRFAAIAQLAVFESVNSITQKYEPYVGTFSAPRGASPEAAAAAAAHKVLVTYFSGKAASLDASYQASLETIRAGESRDDGVALGEAVADAIVALRANDGSSPAKTKAPGPAVPGEYQATASCPIGPSGAKEGSFYHWQDVTPFAISTPKDFLVPPPPALDSGRYTRDYLEVLTVGSASSTERSQDRADVVHVYGSGGPAYLMNSVARQLAVESRGSLIENARTLALINMAMNDALISSLYNKYQYNFWRPETAIHAGDSDGNDRTPADPSFAPFIVTPCYPAYPSNQGSATNAAVGILQRVYGDRHHRISLSFPGVPGVTVTNTRLSEISRDVADARVYGGIHYRFDQVEGQRLGKRIAREVQGAVLRPRHGEHSRSGENADDDLIGEVPGVDDADD